MDFPPRYYVNKVRTALVALVDAHNEKYREPMWPEVSDAGDNYLEVQLTIGGHKPLRFSEVMSFRSSSRGDWLETTLQEWIDEARALGSREQQRRSDGALPPPKSRPKRRAPTLKLVP